VGNRQNDTPKKDLRPPFFGSFFGRAKNEQKLIWTNKERKKRKKKFWANKRNEQQFYRTKNRVTLQRDELDEVKVTWI
jgi:hypothetical protein